MKVLRKSTQQIQRELAVGTVVQVTGGSAIKRAIFNLILGTDKRGNSIGAKPAKQSVAGNANFSKLSAK